MRDCGVWLDSNNPLSLSWISHDDQVTATAPVFDVRMGLISRLHSDRNFSAAACVHRFTGTPAIVMPEPATPAVGDGCYFVVKGVSATLCPYGNAVLDDVPACAP